jgi:hypothetical protein
MLVDLTGLDDLSTRHTRDPIRSVVEWGGGNGVYLIVVDGGANEEVVSFAV